MAKITKTKAKKSRPEKKPRSLKRRLWLIGLSVVAAIVLLLFILFGAVYGGLFGKLPSEGDLRSIQQHNASEVFSYDGELLGKYFYENRSSIAFSDIPKVVIDALIATEDSRFFKHEGIDFYSIPRVVFKTLILGDRSSGGGSTISQQLVKNLFGRDDHGALSVIVNKLKENITALKLEDIYSKEEIITLYLNTVSFGENVFGIKAASYRYFAKAPTQLNVTEAATLVGMLKANTSYNPRLYPEASLKRRNTVLALMVREGSLDPDQFHKLEAEPLGINYRRDDNHQAPAPYLRALLEPELSRLLSVSEKKDGSSYNLYSDGLRITLSVHGKMQQYAEEALKEQMKSLQAEFDKHWSKSKPWGQKDDFIWKEAARSVRYKRLKTQGKSDAEIRDIFSRKVKLMRYTPDGGEVAEMSPLDSIAWHQMVLQAGFVALDARTGRVLAYAGGTDYSYFPYDHVTGKRQAGSTFKPFVYTAALEAGIEPCEYIENQPITFANYSDWTPENSSGGYGGYYTVQGGLAKSVNTVAARLMAETGPAATIDVAKRMGIVSPLPEVPSLALGVADVSLLEMVTAYCPFANGGEAVQPWYIARIATREGKVLYEHKQVPNKRAIDETVAHSVRQMLQLAADSGTARSIHGRYRVQIALGGKTGTTQNNADGWFIGITPHIAMGAWVGGQSPIVRFRSTALGQGAATALPIIANFLRRSERHAETKKLLGTSFTPSIAYIPCDIFANELKRGFLDGIFDKDSREQRREQRQQEREERKKNREADQSDDRWMKRLLEKLKKKENQ